MHFIFILDLLTLFIYLIIIIFQIAIHSAFDGYGLVVTNFHVIQGAQSIQVRLDTGEAIRATYVGGSPDRDLAVIFNRPIKRT